MPALRIPHLIRVIAQRVCASTFLAEKGIPCSRSVPRNQIRQDFRPELAKKRYLVLRFQALNPNAHLKQHSSGVSHYTFPTFHYTIRPSYSTLLLFDNFIDFFE